MNITAQKLAESVRLKALINPSLLAQHYGTIFKAFRCCRLIDPTIVCRESDLDMRKLLVAKAKLSNAKTPGHNGIRFDFIK